MKRLWSSRWAVATGSAVTVLVVVALMATGVLPVKVTLRMTGWAIRYSLISAGTP